MRVFTYKLKSLNDLNEVEVEEGIVTAEYPNDAYEKVRKDYFLCAGIPEGWWIDEDGNELDDDCVDYDDFIENNEIKLSIEIDEII